MKVPSIFNYTDCIAFLKDLYEMNKTSEGMSYRSLAYELNWSSSYLHDVITGRKNLTLTRALELARYTNLGILELERLIYLSLSSSGTEDVKKHFLDKLEKEKNIDSRSPSENIFPPTLGDYDETIEELKGDVCASAILKLLVWAEGKIQLSEIPQLLYMFSELTNREVLFEKIDKLIRNKNIELISKNDDFLEVKILRSDIHFVMNKETISINAEFTDNMSKIFRHEKVSGYFNLGYLTVNYKKAKEIQLRMHAFRNWLLEVEKESLAMEKKTRGESLIFQYEINFAPIIDHKILGINNLYTWEKSGK